MASQKMNEFIFWSVQRFFAVRFAHSMASFAGCPEAVDCDFVSRSASSFYGDKGRFSASLLTQKRSVPLPRQISVSSAAF